MSGKGSAPRPFSIPKEQFDRQWETIFRKQPQQQPVKDPPKPMESLDPR